MSGRRSAPRRRFGVNCLATPPAQADPPTYVLALGDEQYEDGQLSKFQASYLTRRGGVQLAIGQLGAGWARVVRTSPRFQLFKRFRVAQRRARPARRGAWAACGGHFPRRARS